MPVGSQIPCQASSFLFPRLPGAQLSVYCARVGTRMRSPRDADEPALVHYQAPLRLGECGLATSTRPCTSSTERPAAESTKHCSCHQRCHRTLHFPQIKGQPRQNSCCIPPPSVFSRHCQGCHETGYLYATPHLYQMIHGYISDIKKDLCPRVM